MEPSLAPSDSTQGASLDRLLLAAEAVFAEKGFEGAGMKAIAQRAEASQSLLHYHFGNKENLYAEVIRARSKLINARRTALLEQVDFNGSRPLRQVLHALFAPPLGPEGGGLAYARIFSGLMVGRRRDQELVRECYDPVAHRFVAAIDRALPGIGRGGAGTVYQLALGVLASAIARDGRMERLMGHEDQRLEEEALLERLITFVEGGAGALLNA